MCVCGSVARRRADDLINYTWTHHRQTVIRMCASPLPTPFSLLHSQHRARVKRKTLLSLLYYYYISLLKAQINVALLSFSLYCVCARDAESGNFSACLCLKVRAPSFVSIPCLLFLVALSVAVVTLSPSLFLFVSLYTYLYIFVCVLCTDLRRFFFIQAASSIVLCGTAMRVCCVVI